MLTAEDVKKFRDEYGVGLDQARRILAAREFKARFRQEIADLRKRSMYRDNGDLDVIADIFEMLAEYVEGGQI